MGKSLHLLDVPTLQSSVGGYFIHIAETSSLLDGLKRTGGCMVMYEGLFYKKKDNGAVCLLCPQTCHLKEGQRGLCGVREVQNGTLVALNYAKVGAIGVDVIEKKPLYHFYPGSLIFSLGTAGCNLACGFCQNWQLVMGSAQKMTALPPEELARLLQEDNRLSSQLGVAYTYAEPSMWYEYILDCAPLVRKINKKNVLVTNGFINPKPLAKLLPYIDAMNIDVKAFNEEFYSRNCAGRLAPVLETVKRAVAACHVEVTYLVIPGENDSREEIGAMARWLGELGRDIPLHLSRYFPNHKMDIPPTPPATLYAAKQVAQKYLNFVYLGNLPRDKGSNTYCPCCEHALITRSTYSIKIDFTATFCPECGHDMEDAFQF